MLTTLRCFLTNLIFIHWECRTCGQWALLTSLPPSPVSSSSGLLYLTTTVPAQLYLFSFLTLLGFNHSCQRVHRGRAIDRSLCSLSGTDSLKLLPA